MGLPKKANHPLWEWMDDAETNSYELAEALDVARPLISYWVNGSRWIPLAVVRQIERLSRGAVCLGDWPRVQDRKTKMWWKNGRNVAGPYANLRPRQKNGHAD